MKTQGRHFFSGFFIFALAAVLTIDTASANDSVDYDEIKVATLAEYREEVQKVINEHEVAGLSVAIADFKKSSGIETYEPFGFSHIEQNKPVTEDTLFRLASISKMFIALSVLKLVEEGKLNLDDKLVDLVPEVEFKNAWSETDPIRLIHLLENTSGWDDFHLSEWMPIEGEPITVRNFLKIHPHTRTSRWRPGSRYSYTNVGPQVTAYIIEKVSGQSFESYVTENFFKPLEMLNSSYRQSKAFKENGASAYKGTFEVPYWHIGARAAGGVNSSAKELSNLLLMFLQRGQFKGKEIISEASLERMELAFTSLDSIAKMDAGYGLHNGMVRSKTYDYFGHDGGLPGLLTRLSYAPKDGKGYLILMTGSDWEAYKAVESLTQNYLANDFSAPDLNQGLVFDDALKDQLSGYYRMISPRNQMGVPIERLLMGHWLEVEEDRITLNAWLYYVFGIPKFVYVRVGENFARGEKDNNIRLSWYVDDDGEMNVQTSWLTLTPSSPLQELFVILLIVVGVLASGYLQLTAFSWFSALRSGGKARQKVLAIHLASFVSSSVAGIGLIGLASFIILSSKNVVDPLMAFGQPSVWSLGIFFGSVLFSLLAIISFVMLIFWYKEIKAKPSKLSLSLVASINLIVVGYLYYWDLIGYQTWAY